MTTPAAKPALKRGGRMVGSYVIRQQQGGGGWWITLRGEALKGPMPYLEAVETCDRYERMSRA